MSTERVSPLVLALAHESCPASGEMFNAGCGWISRTVVALNDGVVLDDYSAGGGGRGVGRHPRHVEAARAARRRRLLGDRPEAS